MGKREIEDTLLPRFLSGRSYVTPCFECRKPVRRCYSERARGVGKFCDKVCESKYKKRHFQWYCSPDTKTRFCPVCKNPFRVIPSRRDARKYCSKKCGYIGRSSEFSGENNCKYLGLAHTAIDYRTDCFGEKYPVRRHVRDINGRMRPEHIVLAEKALGRRLKKGEVVHHVNCDPLDNRPTNLLVCTQGYHMWLHTTYSRRFGQMMFGGRNG